MTSADPRRGLRGALPQPALAVMQGPLRVWSSNSSTPALPLTQAACCAKWPCRSDSSSFPASRFLEALTGESATPVAHDPAAATKPGAEAEPLVVSLFCYEPQRAALLAQHRRTPGTLLVFKAVAIRNCCASWSTSTLPEHHGQCRLTPALAGPGRLTKCCGAAMSTASAAKIRWCRRAVGRPALCLAHLPAGRRDAHRTKLEAFLDWLQAPDDLREFHRIWNGITEGPLPALVPARLLDWQSCVQAARTRLMEQDDLVGQVLSLAEDLRHRTHRHCAGISQAVQTASGWGLLRPAAYPAGGAAISATSCCASTRLLACGSSVVLPPAARHCHPCRKWPGPILPTSSGTCLRKR